MKNILFLSLVLITLVIASPALAKDTDNSFWAAVSKLAQEVFQPKEEISIDVEEGQSEEIMDEDFVDPREIQQVLREMKDMRRELNRLAKQAKRLAGSATIAEEINMLLGQIANFESSINEGVNLRDAIQEFRDAQIWEELNGIRAKVEIPREMAQWNKDIKRLEKLLIQKKYRGLGLNLESAMSKIEEVKAALARVQEFYNSGDFESAMEEFNDLRQDFHPGDIMSILQRMQELMNRLKTVKNAEVKNQIQEALNEVIDNFNEGEFRMARELMDESWNDIMKLIMQAVSVGKKRGVSKENFFKATDKFESQMKTRAEEKRAQVQPQSSVQPVAPAPNVEIKPALEPTQ